MKYTLGTLLALGTAAILNAAPLLKSSTPLPARDESYQADFAAGCREAVIPELKQAPDLRNFPDSWRGAAKLSDFKTVYRRALQRAKGMAAAGEWEKFLDKTLRPPEETTVYAGYDRENLYLAVECGEKSFKNVTAIPGLKRDDKIYTLDSVELLIFSNRADNSFKHFMSDVHGQRYDALRDDAANRNEVNWNPDYTLQVGRRGEHWILFWTLPWRILGIDPVPGREFALNVVRNKIAGKEYSSLAGNRNHWAERDRLVRIHLGRKASRCRLVSAQGGPLTEGANTVQVKLNNPGPDKITATLTARCGNGAEVSRPVELAPKSAQTVAITVDGAVKGANRIALKLTDAAGQVVDSTMFTAEGAEKLEAALESYAVMGSENTLAGRVKVNLPAASGLRLEFECGGKKTCLPAKNWNFVLDVADVEGEAVLKVRLTDLKTGTAAAEKNIRFTREVDPFAGN